jgi:hypothetical protein
MRKVCYSGLFTNLVGWHVVAVSFPLSDIILAQLAYPLSDVMFYLDSGITNLSLYKHCSRLICCGNNYNGKMFYSAGPKSHHKMKRLS